MHTAQAEGQQHHPQPAEDKQHGDGIGIVQRAQALLALAQAQADGQTDAQLAGFAAEALQPGEQKAKQGEDQQTGIGMTGRPEAQPGAAGAQAAEHQHTQHAQTVQRVGLGGLEGTGRGPEKARMSAEQPEQQRQRAAEAGDHRRAPGGRAGMPAEGLSQ